MSTGDGSAAALDALRTERDDLRSAVGKILYRPYGHDRSIMVGLVGDIDITELLTDAEADAVHAALAVDHEETIR